MVGKSAARSNVVTGEMALWARTSQPAHESVPDATARPVMTAGQASITSSTLLASLTHELRTPVAALATGSELLLEDFDRLSRDDLLRIVETMYRGAVWLQVMVENVLLAASLAEGAFRMYPRPLKLIELARDIASVVDPLIQQRRQRLRLVDRLAGRQVVADSRRIGQILVNLISNASKYSGPGTVIDVRLSRRDGGVRLSVADRGPGLPAGSARTLFGPFTRGISESQHQIDGTGLGLSIVQSIAELHGGRAGASRRRGGGALFWVDLPLAAPQAIEFSEPGTSVRERLA
ncbi:MAG: sensor histidine kinase [Chloroflexota bacterium]